jgi:hypothetical protein
MGSRTHCILTLATLVMASTLALQADTTVVLGHADRDLTGDGKPEILRVIGVGPSIDDLGVTFTIESEGRTIYRFDLGRMTRTLGYYHKYRVASPEEHRARLKEFGPFFFDERKFQRPADFISEWRKQAPGRLAETPSVIERDRDPSDKTPGRVIWDEIQNAPVTIFSFSHGLESIEAIGWNTRAGRFYRLVSCC